MGSTSLIVLDTNVLAELPRVTPAAGVLAWARDQDPEAIFTTAVCEAELLFGVAAMAEGRRRSALARAVEAMLGAVLGGRVLSFDRKAARIYGELAAQSRRAVGMADLQIAAIARAHGADAIATRNTPHFADCGVALVNPWVAGTASTQGRA